MSEDENIYGKTPLGLEKTSATRKIEYTNCITPEDYSRLQKAVGWNTHEPERVQAALERSDFIVAARDCEQTVGMARVMHDGLQAMIMDVIVLPAYQGQGIGKAMMQAVMEYLDVIAQKGMLKVHLMSASGKEGFYKQFGFRERPNEWVGCGMSQWLKPR